MAVEGVALIVSGENARYARAEACIAALTLPPGWVKDRVYGTSVAGNLNVGVGRALQRGAKYIWIMGDDHVFDSLIVFKLLSRHVDLVAPLVTYRRPPFLPIAFKTRDTSGFWSAAQWEDLPKSGLMNVAALTNAGLLVSRAVFEQVTPPWFTLGELDPEHMSEDLMFCAKARAKGFQVYLDVDITIEHLTPIGFVPVLREDNTWGIDFTFDQYGMCHMPQESSSVTVTVPA